jgi:hypothetical protein
VMISRLVSSKSRGNVGVPVAALGAVDGAFFWTGAAGSLTDALGLFADDGCFVGEAVCGFAGLDTAALGLVAASLLRALTSR